MIWLLQLEIRDTGDKLKKEVKETRKEIENFEKKKLISDKLISSLQQDNLQLKKNLSLEIAENEKLKQEKDTIDKKLVDLEKEILTKTKKYKILIRKWKKIQHQIPEAP